MYVDASALSAILKNEPERHEFLRRLESADRPMTSPISAFEAALSMVPMIGSCGAATSEVHRLIVASRMAIVDVGGSSMMEMALARDRYGKGSGSPAQLNLGDCVSYSLAKIHGVPLLYKGNDFAMTDLR
ncbi:MAG: type II toxin-antitoxin system VapC family toxin [Rhizobiaceae bacterium]|nr:type II toxin-antitoxin system VapC family toxin [Rhizobiaceae bacterium]